MPAAGAQTSRDGGTITTDLVIKYVVAPVAALLLSSPIELLLAPEIIRGRAPSDSLLIAAPFWIGLAAAPGYIAGLRTIAASKRANALHRFWVRASIVTGALCSLVGTAISLVFVLPAIASAAAFIAALRLLLQYERMQAAGRREGWHAA